MTSNGARVAQARFSSAVQRLAATDGVLADVLAGLTAVVVEEAAQNAGFRARLSEVLGSGRAGPPETAADAVVPAVPASTSASPKPRSSRGRRAPGPWDPYGVYADVGEAGLRDRLGQLELEQLRDIISEHGMNNDGLAMRWKKADRVVDRIVERVVDRAAKGDAFRSA